MTQALALQRILESAGHELAAVFMGENPERPIPDFFKRRLRAPLHTYPSPAFVLDRDRKGVRRGATFAHSVFNLPRYLAHASTLHGDLVPYRPELLVNFYEVLGGVYTALYRPRAPLVAIGHQFLFFHPALPVPRNRGPELATVRLFTRLTAPFSALRLALSFTPLRDLPERRIRVVPPLLREAVLDAHPTRGQHLLAYVLYPGYAEELSRWQEAHPEVDLHCFWARSDTPAAFSPRPGLTYHRLDDRTFLELLATCRGFTSTAGFESVCEAAFLGKPVLVVPTAHHLEQLTNALDARRAGVAVWRHDFDLTEFVGGLDQWDSAPLSRFREWVRSAPETFLRLLEGVASGRDPLRIPLSLPAASGSSPP
jgi:uncharacterized protein (TIGR00661 family)